MSTGFLNEKHLFMVLCIFKSVFVCMFKCPEYNATMCTSYMILCKSGGLYIFVC